MSADPRCPGGTRLRSDLVAGMDDWPEDRAEWFDCPPCRRRSPMVRWLVTAGLHVAVIAAYCPDGAREQMARRMWPRRRGWYTHADLDRITARPATAADVARHERMVAEDKAGAR